MSHADELATYIDALDIGLDKGTNLFVGSEPNTPADCSTLYDTGGRAPYQDFDGSNWVYHPSVQIRVRNAAYLTGDILIRDIRDGVKQIVHTTLSGTRYEGVFLASDVIHLGKIDTNAGTAHVWTLNLDLITED